MNSSKQQHHASSIQQYSMNVIHMLCKWQKVGATVFRDRMHLERITTHIIPCRRNASQAWTMTCILCLGQELCTSQLLRLVNSGLLHRTQAQVPEGVPTPKPASPSNPTAPMRTRQSTHHSCFSTFEFNNRFGRAIRSHSLSVC